LILLRAIIAIAVIEAAGALALRWLMRPQRSVMNLEFLGLAFGLGIGMISLGTFYLAFAGAQLNPSSVSMFVGGLFAGLITLNASSRSRAAQKEAQLEEPRKKCGLNRIELALAAMIFASCFLVAIDALSQPILGFDARAIWGMKAKIIFSNHQIYGEDFLDPDRLHAKQRYPLGLPLALNFTYQAMGQLNDRFVKVIFAAFFLALPCFFYGALRRIFDKSYSLLGTCLLSTLPCFTIYANGGAASGYSDVPLTYFYTVFALSLFLWFRQNYTGDFVLALVFGIFALFTKNEGLPLWGITLMCFVFCQPGSKGRQLPRLGWLAFLLVASLAALLPWHLYRSQLPLLEEDYFQLLTLANLVAGIDRLLYVSTSFLREFILRPHLWSLLGPCLALAFCASPRLGIGRSHGVFLRISALYCGFLVLIYLVIPWEMDELIPVSLTRLLMPLSPVLVFWLLFQTKETKLLPEGRWTSPAPK